MQYRYRTKMTCSREILFDIQDGVISNVQFIGGCNGNLKAISKLIDGWAAEQIAAKLRGNLCNNRPTSCADQLAVAVTEAAEAERSAKGAAE